MLVALRRARLGILTIALTYAFSAIIGIAMVQSGNKFALGYGDRIVGQASASDPAALELQRGRKMKAALLDFGGNLLLGSLPQTISGLGIVPPYGFAAFRGWVGGIVSVDSDHHSRLSDPRERTYYLTVLILQLIPYSLTGGAGVHLGLSWYREWRRSGKSRWWWLPLPRSAVIDALWLYLLAAPLFLFASLVEFLAR